MANVHMLDPSGNDARRVELMQRIVQLRLEHRDLDTALERLSDRVDYDAIQLTRLKRRKLLLKDPDHLAGAGTGSGRAGVVVILKRSEGSAFGCCTEKADPSRCSG